MKIITVLVFLSFLFEGCQERSPQKILNQKENRSQEAVSKDTILIVTMSFSEKNLLKPIREKVASFYHVATKVLDARLPQSAYLPQRNRYRANEILNHLKAFNSGRYSFVAGLTSEDISTTRGDIKDWGIFGLGTMDAGACVSSSFRLKRNASEKLLLERLQKVILHEIGHNHGLPHCTTLMPCFMKAAEGKISTVDNEPMDVCGECRKKIGF